MMISSRGRYALRVMIDLAENTRNGGILPLSDISARLDISRKYLEAIMTSLAKADLVESQPGKAGGYRLTRSPEDYTALDILVLTEGTLAPVSCVEKGCGEHHDCPSLPLWEGLDKVIRDYLTSVSLADLAKG